MVWVFVVLALLVVVVSLLVEAGTCAVAYRINCGHKGLDISVGRWMVLSLIAAILPVVVRLLLVVAGMFYPFGAMDYCLVALIGIPLHAQWLNWVYGLENWLSGLGMVFLRIVPYAMLAAPVYVLIRSSGGSLL